MTVPLTLSKVFPHVPIIIRHMLSNNVSIFFYHLNPLLNVENPALFCCGLRPPPRQPRWPAARLWTYSVHYMCPFIGDFHTAAARKTGGGRKGGAYIHIHFFPLPPPTPRRAKSNIFCQTARGSRWERTGGTQTLHAE